MDAKNNLWSKIRAFLPDLYYITAIASLLFILFQVFYAKESLNESSKWEKAKITIDNIEKYRTAYNSTLFAKPNLIDMPEGYYVDFTEFRHDSAHLPALIEIFDELIIKSIDSIGQTEYNKAAYELINLFDAFAYPIIKGYADEHDSFKSLGFHYIKNANFVIYKVYNGQYPANYMLLLYRLWHPEYEKMLLNDLLSNNYEITDEDMRRLIWLKQKEDFTPENIKRRIKYLDKKKELVWKEIYEYRKNSNN